MRHVLFICSGNFYRSRFAEAVFNHAAQQRGTPWRAISRGLATHLVDGAGDLSLHTRFALISRGIPLSCTAPRPRQLSLDDLEGSDRIIALKEAEHRTLMRALFPEWENRIEYWHVHDLDVGLPGSVVPELERLVLAVLDDVAASDRPTATPPRRP